LLLCGWDVRTTEAAVHRRLGSYRLRGEWFTICQRVLAELSGWDWLDPKVISALTRRLHDSHYHDGRASCLSLLPFRK
jgi:hypothetical protein